MSPCTPSVVALARRSALAWNFKFHNHPPGIEGWVRVSGSIGALTARLCDHRQTKNQEKKNEHRSSDCSPHSPNQRACAAVRGEVHARHHQAERLHIER